LISLKKSSADGRPSEKEALPVWLSQWRILHTAKFNL